MADRPSPEAAALGLNLKRAREGLNLSRKDAAERLKAVRGGHAVSHVAIGHYETGYRVPSIPTLLELAQAYEVKAADLLPRENGDKGRGPATDITVRVRPGNLTLGLVEENIVRHLTELGVEAFIVTSSLPYSVPEGY